MKGFIAVEILSVRGAEVRKGDSFLLCIGRGGTIVVVLL